MSGRRNHSTKGGIEKRRTVTNLAGPVVATSTGPDNLAALAEKPRLLPSPLRVNENQKKARIMHDETKILCYDFSKQSCGREFDPRNELKAFVKVGLLTPQPLNIPIVNRNALRQGKGWESPTLARPPSTEGSGGKLWSNSSSSQGCLFLCDDSWSTAVLAVVRVVIAVGRRARVEGKELESTLRKKVKKRKITLLRQK